ncbi:mechanosensitive ion channel family protein [Jejuia pallidilutea]|jgi:small conductance mechanosensitive channel|uniref:Small-conductance mechanosensitive channel n=1 Tax=Jejuia pallidilutea TaxID=504487 RepID=A0A090W0S4_9FLAO|nr:mechanosensitive ion channel domain-containing protein [Jejuia pallidilutea]PQV46004.1 small conductance mechanosensitive channel [Jejuia pallidilutea]GAL65980.1 small-conductance mechanosensitive channel [Jejuia pallidilutea]GAL70625.1 small-conductance mechanosensitive channel [Jejuia pallidilutea]GAL88042.1 small-conductance mechanosensitive channel [Jejuia pallidilutea]
MNLENIDTEKWLELGLDYGLKILGAIIIWIIGSWVIKNIIKGTRKIMTKRDYDESLQKFLLNLFGWILKIVLIIVVLGTVGVETTSFAAIIAAAGLAIGLALQGSLGNFAGGVLIMIFKPFKIGDLIEAQGEIGVVKEIEIFTTKLTGLSNREIIIPNGSLSNGNIINYTTEGTRRVDLVFGVGYDSDIKKTKEVLMNVLTSHPKVLKDPAPSVNVMELADSSINFAVRPWSTADDYWDVYFGITEDVKEALDKAGIEIPYPHQVEIHKES